MKTEMFTAFVRRGFVEDTKGTSVSSLNIQHKLRMKSKNTLAMLRSKTAISRSNGSQLHDLISQIYIKTVATNSEQNDIQ